MSQPGPKPRGAESCRSFAGQSPDSPFSGRRASLEIPDSWRRLRSSPAVDGPLARFHRRLGGLGISLLMLPILGWVWLAAKAPVLSVADGSLPRYVLSGEAFSKPFDIGHAGFAMDQPTIGKWLFWFTFMTASSLPCAAGVAWLACRQERSGQLAFALWAGVLGLLLLSILSWPLLWLLQFVASMGITPRRLCGLLYSLGGGLVVATFVRWAVRRPRKTDSEEPRTTASR